MNPLEFEEIIKPLNKEKYHICRTMKIIENEPSLIEWQIFRKDMSEEEYFSSENLAVLSSEKGNTIEDIKKLIEYDKEQKNE